MRDSDKTEVDPAAEKHRERMVKILAAHQARQAKATGEKGLLMVNTGPGKGKSSAAFGMGIRVVGQGWRLGPARG